MLPFILRSHRPLRHASHCVIDTAHILSFSRSGSTLLNLILGSHSQAVAVGEITHLPKNLALDTVCTCGVAVRTCPFWMPIIDVLSTRIAADLRRNPYALELGFINASTVVDHARQTKAYRALWRLRHGAIYFGYTTGMSIPAAGRRRFDLGIEHTRLLFEAIREASGANVVVDASKVYMKGVGLYVRDPQNNRVFLLSRDGRAVMYSHLRSGFERHAAVMGWKNYYVRTLALLERCVRREHVLRVTYERLISDPDSEARRSCEFLGLQFEPAMLDFRAKVHHITNGNDMRLASSRKIVADNAWQTELSAADLAYFERSAGPLNRLLGYE